MNYAPGIQDQRGNFIMQGNALSQRSGILAMQLYDYLQSRADRKDAAVGELGILSAGGNDDQGEKAGGGFNPSSGGSMETGDEGNPAMDQAEMDGKKAHSIRTMLSNYTDDPQQKTALKAKSLGELEGMLKGYATQSAMQEHAARIADYNAQAALRIQTAQDDQSIGRGLTRFANMPDVKTSDDEYQDTGAQTRPPTADERMRYALDGVAGRAAPKLLSALSNYTANQQDAITGKEEIYPGMTAVSTRRGTVQMVEDPRVKNQAEALTDRFVEDPVSGARFHTYGKTSQASGFNPETSKGQLVPQIATDGTLVGWSSNDPRGHGTFVANRGGPFKAARDEDGNILPGYYKDASGKVLDVRTVLEKHLGKAGPEAEASTKPTALPMPKTKADAVKGKLYNTPRGLAVWDGSKFIPQ